MATATSKLDSLSKEDLIKFVKKQLTHGKENKEEINRLRQKLEESEKEGENVTEQTKKLETENARLCRRVEELETKQSFLLETTQEQSDQPTATEMLLRARITELENELKQIPSLKDEVSSLTLDISTIKEEMHGLSSQLEDKVAELAALRDQKSTADMFSLEIEDYAKKVRALEKDLATSKASAKTLETEITILRTELDESRSAQTSLDEDHRKFQQEIQKLTNDLYESQIANSQQKQEISSLRDQLNGLMENQGSERLGMGRELAACQQRVAALEEVSEALREENLRLRENHNHGQTRMKELEQEYENFKSRARFVLEQKKTTTADEEAADKAKADELEARVAELKTANEVMKRELAAKHDELERFKERTTTALADLETKRREADELHVALSNSLDELRSYRIKFENVVSQLTETSQRLGEADNEKALLRQDILKSEALLQFERNRFEEMVDDLNKQLLEEREKRDELSRQLDETRREQKTVRMPPVAAVQPQVCEFEGGYGGEHSSLTRRQSPDSVSQQLQTQEDRSLEDVLFGEEFQDALLKPPTVENISELMDELFRLRKHAEHTTSLLNESEAANGRLIEQSRCLKEEIRRLERNEERKSHLENTEYLKNVIIKFLTPEKVAAEKCQLIPILNTMLRLSEEEINILQRAAQLDGSTSPPSGAWGSYFKWGGMS